MNFSTIHSTHTTPKYNSYHRCIHHIATTSAPARPHEVYQLWPRDKALRPSLFRIEGSARRWKERLLQVPSTSLRPPNFQGEAAGVFRSVSQPPLACGGVGACRRRDHPGPPRLVLSGSPSNLGKASAWKHLRLCSEARGPFAGNHLPRVGGRPSQRSETHSIDKTRRGQSRRQMIGTRKIKM